MNPARVDRNRLQKLTDLPNIGPAMAKDFEVLGITRPQQIEGMDPLDLYQNLCEKTGVRHDPCVLDAFISVTRFMAGEAPKPWWHFTEERKRVYGRL